MKILVVLFASVFGFGLACQDVANVQNTTTAPVTVETLYEEPVATIMLDTVEVVYEAPVTYAAVK